MHFTSTRKKKNRSCHFFSFQLSLAPWFASALLLIPLLFVGLVKISRQHLHCSNYSWSGWVTSKPTFELSRTYTDIHTNTKRAIQIPYNRFRTNHVHVTVAFRKISTLWFHFENWYRNNHQWWCIIRMVKRICKNMSNNCKGRCRSLVYRLAHTSDHSSALPNSIHTPNFSNVVKDGVK